MAVWASIAQTLLRLHQGLQMTQVIVKITNFFLIQELQNPFTPLAERRCIALRQQQPIHVGQVTL